MHRLFMLAAGIAGLFIAAGAGAADKDDTKKDAAKTKSKGFANRLKAAASRVRGSKGDYKGQAGGQTKGAARKSKTQRKIGGT